MLPIRRLLPSWCCACALSLASLSLAYAAPGDVRASAAAVAPATETAPPAVAAAPIAESPAAVAAPEQPVPMAPRQASRHALAGRSEGVFGSALWGGHGVHRLASPFALRPGALALTVSDSYYQVKNVFIRGDADRQSTQGIDLLYAPVFGLELSASTRAVAHRYNGQFERVLQTLGSPTFRAKYGRHVAGPVALGVQGEWLLPTSAHGTGLSPGASSYTLQALVGVMLGKHVELTGNVGYIYDRSAHLFPNDDPDEVQALAYQLNRISQVPWGVGGQGKIDLGRYVDLAPFLEVTGGIGTSKAATRKNNPLRLTAGLKVYPQRYPVAELGVGCDVGLGGLPAASSPFGGVPRWNVFARATVHLDNIISRPPPGAGSSCQSDRDCPSGVTCITGQCVLRSAEPSETFELVGNMLDAETRAAVLGASLEVSGFAGTALAVSETDGSYRSWPLPCGSDMVRVVARAPGYRDNEQIVPRAPKPGDVRLDIAMQPDRERPAYATLKVAVRDLGTGAGLSGARVTLAGRRAPLRTDGRGLISTRQVPGRIEVTIAAKGYKTQKRTLTLHAGQTAMVNVDLQAQTSR